MPNNKKENNRRNQKVSELELQKTESDDIMEIPTPKSSTELSQREEDEEGNKSIEKTFTNANITILTEVNNKRNLFPKIINEAKMLKDLIFVNKTFENKEKKKKKLEKCIKRVIFFLLIVACCSLLYILMNDFKFIKSDN